MEIMLNATLAGGVIIGACSDVVVTPGAAIIIGGSGGIISALGFAYLSKALQRSIGLHDTCGVHNLHGIPGILGGCIGAVAASIAGTTLNNREAIELLFPAIKEGRTYKQQGAYQMAALGVSLGLAIMGGAFSGFCASRIGHRVEHLFDDEEHWHACAYDVPLEEEFVEGDGKDDFNKEEQVYDDEPEDQREYDDDVDGKENIN